MRTIIAGSRDTPPGTVDLAMAGCDWASEISEVLSGMARGADSQGEEWARDRGIRVRYFPVLPVDWERHGKGAGPRRNAQMANHADALVAVWDGKSPGTKSMIGIATRRGLRVFVHRYAAPAAASPRPA